MAAVPTLAAALSTVYLAGMLLWRLAGHEFPVGTGYGGALYLLMDVPSEPLGLALALLAAAGSVLGLAVLYAGPRRALLRLVQGYAGVLAVLALVLLGDAGVLAVLGYLPFIVINLLLGMPAAELFANLDGPALLHQVVLSAVAVLWALASVDVGRRIRNACRRCGRTSEGSGWRSAAAAGRWGLPVTIAAVVIPLLYAATRFAWVAGIPLGIDAEFHRGMVESGQQLAGLGLASMAVVGAVLTAGLVRPWGERFPRWMPGLAGRRVPVMLAVLPATAVAVSIVPAGLSMILGVTAPPNALQLTPANLAAFGPALLWPVWGVALGAATLAYYLRRRGACPDCGRQG